VNGTPLPSEQELVAEFDVSRVTIRNTMALLGEAGLITRQRGRGTFAVPSAVHESGSYSIDGLAENMREFEESTAVDLHEFAEIALPEEIGRTPGCPPANAVLRIRRTRHEKGRPLSYSVCHVLPPESYLLSATDLGNRSVAAVLATKGFVMSRAEQRLTAVAAAGETAVRMRMAESSPLISMLRMVYGADGRLVEHIRTFYDPAQYEYRVDLSREQSGSEPPRWVHRTEPDPAGGR